MKLTTRYLWLVEVINTNSFKRHVYVYQIIKRILSVTHSKNVCVLVLEHKHFVRTGRVFATICVLRHEHTTLQTTIDSTMMTGC